MKSIYAKNKIQSNIRLEEVKRADIYPYFKPISSDQDTVVKINGKEVLMFGSNSYMGLTNHPYIKEQTKKAIDKYGTGCAGSRFLNGTLDIHVELEKKIASFLNKENALIFSTGFQTNLGVVSSITGRHDYIIIDEFDHASIYEGTRLSYSKIVKYKHNDMDHLESILQELPKDVIKLIIVDGVFSMEGDIVDLPNIIQLCEKYQAMIAVDDAHSFGVLGNQGRGTADHFGVSDKTDMIIGTFSKSLASLGGFVASDNDIIEYLKHHARSLIFSASSTPASIASASAAIDIIQEEPWRMVSLWENTNYALKCIKEVGFETGNTQTPIIPIYIRDDLKTYHFTKELLNEGVFVNPVVSPAVKSDSSLIRFSLMATHTKAQIEYAVQKMDKIAKRLNIKQMISQ